MLDSIFWVEVEKIHPNPYQPRREFSEDKLKELSESIRMYGVLQPLVVTRKEIEHDDGGISTEYELIAGERRLRASRLAELSQVPVVIRTGEENDRVKLELAIIENLQREDLNPIDRALAFKQLTKQFGLLQSDIAKKMGCSTVYVSNSLRLLQLPEYILDGLREGKLTEGHARSLLMLSDRPEEQETIFKEVLLKKLSVREVERITRKIASDKIRKKNLDPELLELERKLTETFGTRVQIERRGENGGKLVIDYLEPEDIERILFKVEEERVKHKEEAAGGDKSEPSVSEEEPVDDRSSEEKEEDDSDLYALKNFSL